MWHRWLLDRGLIFGSSLGLNGMEGVGASQAITFPEVGTLAFRTASSVILTVKVLSLDTVNHASFLHLSRTRRKQEKADVAPNASP